MNEQTTEQSLTEALEAFNQPSTVGVATNLLRSTIEGTVVEPLDESEEAEVEAEEQEVETEVEAEVEDEGPSNKFAEEFKSTFGMEPDEAIEVVNDLQNFKQEMLLMREWGVNPSEYDSRITSVKEFYEGLPEGKREQFNSPTGVKAIWNYLSKNTNDSKSKTIPNRTKGTLSKVSSNKAPELIKRSEIISMNDETYSKNYSRINKAFAEGRIIEDI